MRWWAETSVSVSEGNVYVPVCDDQVEVTVHIDISGDGKLRARGNVKLVGEPNVPVPSPNLIVIVSCSSAEKSSTLTKSNFPSWLKSPKRTQTGELVTAISSVTVNLPAPFPIRINIRRDCPDEKGAGTNPAPDPDCHLRSNRPRQLT